MVGELAARVGMDAAKTERQRRVQTLRRGSVAPQGARRGCGGPPDGVWLPFVREGALRSGASTITLGFRATAAGAEGAATTLARAQRAKARYFRRPAQPTGVL